MLSQGPRRSDVAAPVRYTSPGSVGLPALLAGIPLLDLGGAQSRRVLTAVRSNAVNHKLVALTRKALDEQMAATSRLSG